MLCGPQRMAWEGPLGGAEPGIRSYGGKLPDGVETPMERRKGVSAQLSLHNVPLFPSSQYL